MADGYTGTMPAGSNPLPLGIGAIERVCAQRLPEQVGGRLAQQSQSARLTVAGKSIGAKDGPALFRPANTRWQPPRLHRKATRPWRLIIVTSTGSRREQVRTKHGIYQKRIFSVFPSIHTSIPMSDPLKIVDQCLHPASYDGAGDNPLLAA